MARYKKDFRFSFPLRHQRVRDLKLVTEHVGDLQVEGVATLHPEAGVLNNLDERYEVDIDFIKWKGMDILPVLALTGLHDDIQEAALRHCVDLFENVLSKAA